MGCTDPGELAIHLPRPKPGSSLGTTTQERRAGGEVVTRQIHPVLAQSLVSQRSRCRNEHLFYCKGGVGAHRPGW